VDSQSIGLLLVVIIYKPRWNDKRIVDKKLI
jgi:hypothetical protein